RPVDHDLLTTLVLEIRGAEVGGAPADVEAARPGEDPLHSERGAVALGCAPEDGDAADHVNVVVGDSPAVGALGCGVVEREDVDARIEDEGLAAAWAAIC